MFSLLRQLFSRTVTPEMVPLRINGPEWPITYNSDGLATVHNADFLTDPRFDSSYKLGQSTPHEWGVDLHIEWRAHVCCWAAEQTKGLGADYVECGVASGILSRTVMSYIEFEKMPDRQFYLLDTFQGVPVGDLTEEELAGGIGDYNGSYPDSHSSALNTFSIYPNVKIVKGRVPETLPQIDSDRVGYVSIDMNHVAPEIAAGEYLWPRIVPGGIIVLDDYGWRPHIAQKNAWDRFTADRNLTVLSLPTGQGLILKPPS